MKFGINRISCPSPVATAGIGAREPSQEQELASRNLLLSAECPECACEELVRQFLERQRRSARPLYPDLPKPEPETSLGWIVIPKLLTAYSSNLFT